MGVLDFIKQHGIDPRRSPPGMVAAAERGKEIQRQTYDGAPCRIRFNDYDASNWQVVVTRLSDGHATTDLVAKA